MHSRSKAPPLTLVIGGLLAALLTACATAPQPPTDALQVAESAIKHAEEARVADYASLELTSAREKLTAARDAARNENMVASRQLAEEATADADLATAKSAAARAAAANAEVVKSIQGMQQEIQHNAGDKR